MCTADKLKVRILLYLEHKRIKMDTVHSSTEFSILLSDALGTFCHILKLREGEGRGGEGRGGEGRGREGACNGYSVRIGEW